MLRRGFVFLLIFIHYQNINLRGAIHRQLLDILLFEDNYVERLLLPLDLNSFEVCVISHFI